MVMLDSVEHSLEKSRDILILTVYLLNIQNYLPSPLHFFTNNNIDLVNNLPQLVYTKVVHLFDPDNNLTEKIFLLDMSKIIAAWGNDNNHTCLSPLQFLEASKNLLEALRLLSKASVLVDSIGPSTSDSNNHAIEYEKHLNFFKQVKNFENSYSLVQVQKGSLV